MASAGMSVFIMFIFQLLPLHQDPILKLSNKINTSINQEILLGATGDYFC